MIDTVSAWTLIAAVVGALIGFAGTMLSVRPSLARARRDAAAAYLDQVAVAAAGMAEAFLRNEIPHQDGHTFVHLANTFGDYLRPYTESINSDWSRLLEIARKAENSDVRIADLGLKPDGPHELTSELRELSVHLRRLAGDLQAQATQIRTSSHGVPRRLWEFYPPGSIAGTWRAVAAALGVVAFVLTGVGAVLAWNDHNRSMMAGLAAAWACLPPVWFWFEFFVLYNRYGEKGAIEAFKYGQQLSIAIWAATALTLGALAASSHFDRSNPERMAPGTASASHPRVK